MAEPPKTPTKAETRVCRTCNENIVVKNHPWDLFGAKASQENIPSVLERFFELKVALNDGLPSYICSRCCLHKEVKFQEFFRKNTFSRQQQESVLRVKRGKTTAESPSGGSPQTRAARPFKLWYQNWYFPYCSSNEFNILKLKSNICHGIYI